jgi:chromosome segregation ATPase
MSPKTIDYLFEDPPIKTQKFALVTIVGPHMPQKCDVWGLKIRGVADTIENAKTLCQKLLKIDNNYDIYTVEVGKFFPLAVEPHQIQDVEYQNEQLNSLMKSYLENRESANDHWQQRKNQMIQEAIREGKNQEELANRPEHPIAVLQRIKNYEDSIKEIKDKLQNLEEDLQKSTDKFSKYSQEERESAQKQIENAIKGELEKQEESPKETDIQEIRNQMLKDFKLTGGEGEVHHNEGEGHNDDHHVDDILLKIKDLEQQLTDMENFKKTNLFKGFSKESDAYKKVIDEISAMEKEIDSLKSKLNNKELVNAYMNNNYSNTNSETHSIF